MFWGYNANVTTHTLETHDYCSAAKRLSTIPLKRNCSSLKAAASKLCCESCGGVRPE